MKRNDISIIVGPITNLADARFYAAYEFDYLLFDFRKTSKQLVDIALFQEIEAWVTGVRFACLADEHQENFEKCFLDKDFSSIKKVSPNELTNFDFSDKELYIDISDFLSSPVTHYDFVADWFEAHFEE